MGAGRHARPARPVELFQMSDTPKTKLVVVGNGMGEPELSGTDCVSVHAGERPKGFPSGRETLPK